MMSEEERYMKQALKQAKKAYDIDEVPIGCVIVQDGKIIARGYNRRNTDKSVLAHAEIAAISKACKKTGDWRLEDCTLYVTLEPCQMCAGAIVQARIPKVVIGAKGEVYLWADTTELFYETSHLIDAAPQLIAQGEHDERGMTAIGLQDAHAFLEQVVHERTVIGIEVTPER